MINLSHNKQSGAVTFLIATLLLVSSTLIAIFAAYYGVFQQKSASNLMRNSQAFEAAEAGLEYGINYLTQNSATILANKSGGYLVPYSDSNTSNVTMANGSKYTITYTNPIQNNYNLIQITSTGTNDDGTATRVIAEQIQYGSLLFSPPSVPIESKGNVSIAGNSTITNSSGSNTVSSGSTITMSGSSQTVNSGGTASTPGNIQSDLQQNVSSISSQTTARFFANYFGVSMNTVKNNATYTYSNLGNYDSVLNGKTAATIWVDQTSGNASISSTTTIGSPTQPVLLIINGNLSVTGHATIYGVVVVLGTATTTVTGTTTITGGLISTGSLSLSGNNNISFSSSILDKVQQTTYYYAKVPGSWRDY